MWPYILQAAEEEVVPKCSHHLGCNRADTMDVLTDLLVPVSLPVNPITYTNAHVKLTHSVTDLKQISVKLAVRVGARTGSRIHVSRLRPSILLSVSGGRGKFGEFLGSLSFPLMFHGLPAVLGWILSTFISLCPLPSLFGKGGVTSSGTQGSLLALHSGITSGHLGCQGSRQGFPCCMAKYPTRCVISLAPPPCL